MSGNATACPTRGSRPGGRSGRSINLARRKCLLISACLNGDHWRRSGDPCPAALAVSRGLGPTSPRAPEQGHARRMGDSRVRLTVTRRAVTRTGPVQGPRCVDAVVGLRQRGSPPLPRPALGVALPTSWRQCSHASEHPGHAPLVRALLATDGSSLLQPPSPPRPRHRRRATTGRAHAVDLDDRPRSVRRSSWRRRRTSLQTNGDARTAADRGQACSSRSPTRA